MKHLKHKIFEVGNYGISDFQTYNKDMSKSMKDKLFFLDKLDCDLLIDFGCADGAILENLQQHSNYELIGYDIDKNMIKRAKNKTNNLIHITDNWEEIMEIASDYQKPGILLSSVIHEIYSYSRPNEVNKFWNDVFNPLIKTVVIRDMIPSKSYSKFNSVDVKKVREQSNPEMLKEFEEEWGEIDKNYRNLLHWLLKYKYKNNWERELRENYLPITLETLKEKIPSNWEITYDDYYLLKYIKDTIKNDFGIELNEPSHLKMIIENI